MKKNIALFFMLAVVSYNSFSQSEFVRRGKNAAGAGFGFGANSDAISMSIFAGFSYHGILNADIAYSKANGGKVTDPVITPTLTYYFFKQEDAKRTPTVGVSLGYSQYTSRSTSSIAVPDSNMQGKDTTLVSDKKIYAVKLGVSAFHRIGSWKMFVFQPMISSGVLMHRYGWEFLLRGGVSVISRIKGGPLVIVTPAVEMQSGLATFVCTLSAVF